MLHTEIDNGIANVTLDLPPLQLVGGELFDGLADLLVELDRSPARVVVFRSVDPDYFLMHADVERLASIAPSAYVPATGPNRAAEMFDRVHRLPCITIGVLDGIARGGGCEFLSALDLRIGSHRAVIGQPEVPLGILPGAGGTARWAQLVGRARALELLLTGRDIHAEEAFELGWLQALTAAHDLDAVVTRLAVRIARMPAASIAAVKKVVDVALGASVAALTAESDALAALMADGHHIEPMRQFLSAGGQTREGERDRFDEILDAIQPG
jgi:enoyl-CoA hydratase/carnithine racemase